jgi:hypothetical protein
LSLLLRARLCVVRLSFCAIERLQRLLVGFL